MKISDRDKKLILFVLLVAIIALPIVFFIKPRNDKCKELDTELVSLNERYNYLKGLREKQADYEAQIEKLNAERDEMIAAYPGGVLQENTVMFLRGIEKLYDGVRVEAVKFTEPETTVITEGSVENGEYVEGLTSIKDETSFSFRGDYKHIKAIIDYIFNYTDRMVVQSITMDLDKNTNEIIGTVILDQYAVSGNGKDVNRTEIPSPQTGAEDGRLFDLLKDKDGNILTHRSAFGLKEENPEPAEE